MNQVVPAVKRNLDLSENRPIKEAVYEALRKTILLGKYPAASVLTKRICPKISISVGHRFGMRLND